MSVSLTGIALGLLVGLRHAFEPDHLTAVSTLVTDADTRARGPRDPRESSRRLARFAHGGRRGALLGAIWGLGHTLSLVVVGLVLLVVGATLPAHVAAGFECVVAAMLIVLGIRAIAGAIRAGGTGPVTPHRHGLLSHAHPESAPHIHLAGRAVAWRPLVVGLVHGLAGSGALTALVFAELPTPALRIAYITLFGAGSVAGMAIASGLAGVSLHVAARRPGTRRALAMVTGVVSIVVGLLWGIPVAAALLA